MKRTDLKKHAAALLLVLCLLVTSALPALATSANIKLVESSGNPTTGTIRVTLYDSANDKALSGGKLTLYRVAEVKRQNGNLSYEYCGDFYGSHKPWFEQIEICCRYVIPGNYYSELGN